MLGMTATLPRRTLPLVRAAAMVLGLAGGLAGCGLLDVSDPTAIEDSELNDATGAELLRLGVLHRLYSAAGYGAYGSGLLADEFLADTPGGATPDTYDETALDQRESARFEELRPDGSGGYLDWQDVRRLATVAMPKLRAYSPAPDAKMGEMLALRAFAELRLAEDFCSGFPLDDVVNGRPVFSSPYSTDAALDRALAGFDSALALAADSARILRFAQIGRARTLLALGRFSEAGAAVAAVPTVYVARTEYLQSVGAINDQLTFQFNPFVRGVADREGGTGFDFVSAGDPRIQVTPFGMAQDGVTVLYAMIKYPTLETPIVLASGIEARLIEAEAALKSGGDWLGVLNALRTTCTDAAACPNPAPAGSGGVAGLPPLTDPAIESARVDLVFRERAFWLFATGHRLADLRRLVRWYGRLAESVFPTGAYRQGGIYSTATSIPFPTAPEAKYNPAITGCTSR